MKKKKVVLFSQSGVGGAERMTANIGKAFDLERFEVVFYLVDAKLGDSDLSDFLPSYYRIERLSRHNPVDLMLNFYRTLKKEKPDYVFCSAQYMNRKLLLLSPLFRKCQFIVRNANYLYTHNRLQKLMMAISYPLATKVITQTEEMSEELIKGLHLRRDKVVCMHNPVDKKLVDEKVRLAPYTKLLIPEKKSDIIRYVAVGRFAEEKGFDLLVKAFAEVVKMQPNSELVIVGNIKGNSEETYNTVCKIVDSCSLTGKVFMPGYTDNPYAYELTSDCFVLSSRNEGLPNVLVEAQYLGLPAAAFKCIPVIERIVSEGVTGFLAEKGDTRSLASAMLKAPALGKVETIYKSASLSDYTDLFQDSE